MNAVERTVLRHITPTSHVHDVSVSQPPEMSDTLRLSYLLTLPFFNTVAFLTNLLTFCIFSTGKLKKYRASVFFRYLAVMDAAHSCVVFGLMWLTLAAPTTTRPPPENHMHCRMYTVLRYTLQDLSAYGLVCLLMERCSAMSAKTSRRPACVLLTVCRFQWVVRHLSCKLFLLTMSLLALVLNMGIVLSARHELEQPSFTDCFNTWKSPQDFTYDFRSLAMNHALLSMVIPALCCVVGYFCLRVILSRQPWASVLGPPGHADPPTRESQQRTGARRPACPVTHARWIHLGFHPNTHPSTLTPGLQPPGAANVAFRPPPPSTTSMPAPALTMMSVDEVQSAEEGSLRGSSFLDRLYAMIKSREFVLSIVCVEDSRLASQPPADLSQEFNAMAGVAAVFFILLVQPQLLLMMVGCILRSGYHSAMDWSLMKNVGLAADLIFNNRISFTLFLFLFVSGKRVSTFLIEFLRHFFSCWCCRCLLLLRRCPRAGRPHPAGGVRFSFPGTLLARPEVSVLAQPAQGQPGGGAVGCCPPPATGGGGEGGGEGQGQGQIEEGHVEVVPKVSIMTPS